MSGRKASALRASLAACLLVTTAHPSPLRAATCDQGQHLPRPIPLGISGGNIAEVRQIQEGNVTGLVCGGGTLGALVQDGAGKQFILSNNHVIGRSNLARRGEPIGQPGLQDAQCQKRPTDLVARFTRRIPTRFGRRSSNVADAAIARIKRGRVSEQIYNIGPISSVPATPAIGLRVQKMGSTTCLTSGVIAAVGV